MEHSAEQSLPFGVSLVNFIRIIYYVNTLVVIESYDLTGRHTYFSMAITAGCALVLFISLVVLYKSLAPVTEPAGENVVIEATSKLSMMAESIFSGRYNIHYDLARRMLYNVLRTTLRLDLLRYGQKHHFSF